jgi:peroxiredoxin
VNTLSTESKSTSGPKIRQWIYKENIPELVKWVEGFTSTAPPLSDLILLKMLHDAFYSGEFRKPAILHMLSSDYFKGNSQPEIRIVAREVELKLNFLQRGTAAPEICLPDISNKTFCSASNSKTFLYVLFADLEIPVCREQVKYLKTMAEKTGSNLQILVVATASEKVSTGDFISKYQVPGIIVTDTENAAGKKYRVRSYPSAFLLDKGHKVILAPAKTPLDGFEFQFAPYK